MKQEIKKLYHYTDINKLALILKSKSIRFGRLDKVNDPMEGLSSDFHSMAPYIFISSWTANEIENLALWNMYTPSMRGVRIELSLPLFKSHYIKEIENALVSEKEFINNDVGYFILGAENTPNEIIYTDEESLLTPMIKRDLGLKVKSLSKYKRSIWAIEQEYRYHLHVVPIDNKIESNNYSHKYSGLVQKQIPPPIDCYYIKLDDTAFKNMKIRLGPKLLDGDKVIIESIVNNLNPSATIEDSKLSGLVR